MKCWFRLEKKYVFDLCLLLVVIFVVYFNSLLNGFVYDDVAIIAKNPLLQNPAKSYLIFTKKYFVYSYEMTFRPIVTISYLFDYLIWGIRPLGYHLTNLIIHILNVILVYLFSSVLVRKRVFSFLNALLFGILSINSEAVNAIGYREDLLTTFFFVFGFLLYLTSCNAGILPALMMPTGRRHYNLEKSVIQDNYPRPSIKYLLIIASGFSYFLALLSKEMAITFLLIIIVFDVLFYGSGIKKFWKSYAFFFLVTLLYLLLRFVIFKDPNEEKVGYIGGNLIVSLLITSKIFLKYILLTLLPIRLSVEYVVKPPESFFDFSIIIVSILVHFAMIILSIVYLKKDKRITFFIWFFYISLLPVANIIPIANQMAERYMYLPSISLSFLICLLLLGHCKKNIGLIILFLFILFNIGITFKQNRIWKNELTLWMNAVKIAPDSERARIHLGDEYYDRGLVRESINEYLQSIKINPRYHWAYNKLGWVMLETKNLDDAIKMFTKAIELKKNFVFAYNHLGYAYYLKKDYKKAEAAYQLAIQINKYYLDPYINLSNMYLDMDEIGKAKQICIQAIDINYNLKEIHTNLGIIYSLEGKMDKAEQEFKTTIEIDDSYVNGYFNLGLLYQKKGDDAKAERYFKKTIEMDKTSEKAYLGLAFIYKKRGLVQDALRLYQELLNINPGNTTPMIEIGTIYFEMGKFSEAKEYFENVLKIDKDSTVAKSYLQRISEKNG